MRATPIIRRCCTGSSTVNRRREEARFVVDRVEPAKPAEADAHLAETFLEVRQIPLVDLREVLASRRSGSRSPRKYSSLPSGENIRFAWSRSCPSGHGTVRTILCSFRSYCCSCDGPISTRSRGLVAVLVIIIRYRCCGSGSSDAIRTRLLPSVNLNESTVVRRGDVEDLDVLVGRVDVVEAFEIARERESAWNACLGLDACRRPSRSPRR